MARASHSKARWLPIAELATQWAPELRLTREFVEQELRLYLLNFRRFSQGDGWVKEFPSVDALPAATEQLDQAHVKTFCRKTKWPLPTFWFGKEDQGPSFPGRPTIMAAVLEEHRIRASKGQLKPKIIEEAAELAAWAKSKLPGEQIPTAKSIANKIGSAHRKAMSNGSLKGTHSH